MWKPITPAAAATLMHLLGSGTASATSPTPSIGPAAAESSATPPGRTPADTQAPPALPFFQRGAESVPGLPGLRGTAPRSGVTPGRGPDAPGAEPPPPPTRAETLDRLLGRLAKSEDAVEARGIAATVQRLWMQSGSDTADLLMERAVTAMNGKRHDVAAALFDQIIALRPGWAEAWNKRATLRFLDDDDAGSMEDISHVLAIEPRHFGALSGMGFILERHGEDGAALKALRRALSVYPEDADVRKAVDKLTPAVDGQDL